MSKYTPLQQAHNRITELEQTILRMQQQELLRQRIMTGAATHTGQTYFNRMVLELAEILSADYTLIGEIIDKKKTRVRTRAFCADNQLQENLEYDLLGTPCADLLNKNIRFYTEQVMPKFPDDEILQEMNVEGLVGVPLYDHAQQPLGVIVALYREPVDDPLCVETTLQLFANLTAAEILRLHEIDKRSELEYANQAIHERLFETGTLLDENEKILNTIIETLPSPIFYKNIDGIYTGCNQAFCDYLGKTREQIVGRTVYDISPAELAGVYHRADLQLMQKHGTQTYQAQVRYADGRNRDILFSKATIGDPQGNVLGLVGVMTDITELNETKQFISEIINAITDPIFVKDEQHRWQIVNDAFCDFVALEEAKLLGKSDYDFFPREQADIFWTKDQEVLDSGQENINEEQLTIGPGKVRHLETKKSFFRIPSGEKYLVGIIRDITGIRQAEQEMSNLRNLLRNIIDSMPSVLVTIDRQGRVSHWNQQAEVLFGLTAEQASGLEINQAMPLLNPDLPLIDQALISRKTQKITKTLREGNGEKQSLDVMIYPLMAEDMAGAVIRIDNITDRVRIEEMLVQSEKMMSLGGLAAGMAHEINNPLAGIMQSLQVIQSRLLNDLPTSQKLAEELDLDIEKMRRFIHQRDIPKMIENISESSHRAAKTVQSMLSFSRLDTPDLLPCDLLEIIDQTLELAKKDLAKDYDFRACNIIKELPENLPPVLAIKSQLQQVFLNLLKNSAQAIFGWNELTSAPQIRISMKIKHEQVIIEIADNGPGIEEKIRNRIFEPFFTTKDEKNGTGLGLSVSYFIVTNTHNGTLSVDSTPGQGACFRIGLQLAPPEPMYNI